MEPCFRCNKLLPKPDIETAINMEQWYRDDFPNTWDNTEGRALVCTECYDEMVDEESPAIWDIMNS